jgi:hypothetical protein
MDPIKGIAEQVKKIAEAAAKANNPVVRGTVESRNPDGSYNVNTGDGGCVRVANLTNQPTQCGAQVVLGIEPGIGQTLTVCPVTVTIGSSTKPCPTDDRTDENEEEVEVPMIFSDDDGNLYDETGALVSAGTGDPAAIDGAHGYDIDFISGLRYDCFVGPTPGYHTLKIGQADLSPNHSGNQGEVNAGATVICQGVGDSSGILLGVEVENTGDGNNDGFWRLVLRNASDYTIIADPGQAAFIADWMTAHPISFYSEPDTGFPVHVSPDPVDGHFWVNVGSATPPEKMGMFKVSSVDASLIQTVELAVPDQFLRRAKRIS